MYGAYGPHTLSLGAVALSSLLGLFPNTRREWIEFVIATVVLWLLMIVAITELELVAMPDQWRLNLANNFFASA